MKICNILLQWKQISIIIIIIIIITQLLRTETL